MFYSGKNSRIPLWQRLAAILLSVCMVYWYYFEIYSKVIGGKTMYMEDVRSKSIMTLRKDFDKGETYAIRAYISGHLEGRAHLYQSGQTKQPQHEYTLGPGKVRIRIRQDWTDPEYRLVYEPEDVQTGYLTIRYHFHTKK